jgi:UDP-2-acetamido-2,6-beta-L-arabino-hexul-4-ose reductase
MIKIGITGQSGFIGTHLFNTLGLYQDVFTGIPFEDEYFQDAKKLKEFVSSCDVIVHLAGVNRHNDHDYIYNMNIQLAEQLIDACTETTSTPHILFSSSTQEERDNPYGKAKKKARIMFEHWAEQHNAAFTGFIIPNVFGPFGNPYYNSVVATFCHQLTHNEQPKIDVDGELKLIYVGELVEHIISEISGHRVTQSVSQSRTVINSVKHNETIEIPHTSTIKVSQLLGKLNNFKTLYFEKGIIPCLDDDFERNLFNTFVCYIDHKKFFPFMLKKNSDNRGDFVELIKLHSGGQISFSTTVPGITRGNHFHTRKAERFAVIKGKASIELRRIGTDKVFTFHLDGNQPSFVDMPVWYTHNITNIGDEELFTMFWINEHFNPEDPDTFFEEV